MEIGCNKTVYRKYRIICIYRYKDCNIKKETNLDDYISVNFSHILTNSAPQKMQIFPAFHRDALY